MPKTDAAVQPVEAEVDRAEREIQEEAERRRIERAEMARLREKIPELDARRLREVRQENESRREDYRSEVQALLQREGGDAAAHAIWSLTLGDPRQGTSEAKQAIAQELERSTKRLNRSGRISLYRKHGLPEPDILVALVQEELARMPSRDGPRTPEEAVLRAARNLLTLPIVARSHPTTFPRGNLSIPPPPYPAPIGRVPRR